MGSGGRPADTGGGAGDLVRRHREGDRECAPDKGGELRSHRSSVHPRSRVCQSLFRRAFAPGRAPTTGFRCCRVPPTQDAPKDLDAILAGGDIEAMKRVFDDHDVEARGGLRKVPALAAYDCPPDLARWLVARGADVNTRDGSGRTPLHVAAAAHQAAVVRTLLWPRPARRDLPPEPLPTPPARHDGTSRITITATEWPEQHAELWSILVPSMGPARTVPGEVVRISGRVANEINGNGSINWDDDFRAMLGWWAARLGTAQAADTARRLRRGKATEEEVDALAEQSVRWVLAHPDPQPLPAPVDYRR